MAKSKLVKNITIDKLAEIINNGFNGQMAYMEKKFEQVATKEQFNDINKRLGSVEKDVKYIKENVEHARKLEQRVDYMENMLDMPAIKK